MDKVSNEKYNKYVDDRNYQILLTGVYTSYSPDLTYYFSAGNISKKESYVRTIYDASITKENKQLKEIYQKIYSLYKEEVPFVGLYRSKNITISTQSMVGTVEPNNYSTFYGIEGWYRR